MNKLRQSKGFTLVELLIVIVVIAILAVVTVVAYNGIQAKANLVKASASVDSFDKLIEMYRIENSGYPDPGTTNSQACLGSDADYPAADGFAAGQCDSSPNYPVYTSSTLNAALGSFASQLPSGAIPAQTWDGGGNASGSVRGVEYSYYGPNDVDIMYLVSGDQKCPRGSTWSTRSNDTTATTCDLSIYVPTGGGGGSNCANSVQNIIVRPKQYTVQLAVAGREGPILAQVAPGCGGSGSSSLND